MLLHKRALRLHHQQPFRASADFLCECRIQGPRHAELDQPHAGIRQRARRGEAEFGERFSHIGVGLAGGHHHQSGTSGVGQHAVYAVRRGEGRRETQPHFHSRFLFEWRVGKANVRFGGVRGADELVFVGFQAHRHGAVHHVRHRNQTGPATGVAGQRQPEQAEIQHIRHIRRRQHRNVQVAQGELAGARQRRRLAPRVVAHGEQHAAVRARAGGIGVAQGVGGAIEPRRFAVP